MTIFEKARIEEERTVKKAKRYIKSLQLLPYRHNPEVILKSIYWNLKRSETLCKIFLSILSGTNSSCGNGTVFLYVNAIEIIYITNLEYIKSICYSYNGTTNKTTTHYLF